MQPAARRTEDRALERLFEQYREHGDVGALAAVYDRTAVELLRVATHMCGEPADAEDAVQATFLAALEAAGEWDASRPLVPWLIGILAHRVQRQRRDDARELEPERLRKRAATTPTDVAEALEFNQALDEAITGLPRLYQSVLVLRLKHGMKPAEIAHALRRPPATVRAQLTRGMDILRKSLPRSFAAASAAIVAVPTRGLEAVREIVLARARDLGQVAMGDAAAVVAAGDDRGSIVHTVARRATRWLPVVATTAALLTTTLLVVLDADPALASIDDVPPSVEPVTASVAVRAGDEAPALPQRDVEDRERLPADVTRRALVVELRSGGRPAAAASVRVESIGASPEVRVTQVTDRWGERQLLTPRLSSPVAARFEASTDADGRCRFDDLEPAFWLVHLPGRSGIVDLRSAAETSVAVAIDDHAVRVRGRVTDERGRPLVDVAIVGGSGPSRPVGLELVRTDANGRFVVHAPPGSFLLATSSGRRSRGVRVTRDAREDVLVALPDGGVDLHGVVRDATGAPAARALVRVGESFDLVESATAVRGPVRIVRTDRDGRFVVPGLDPGDLFVRARARGLGSASTSATVGLDTVAVELELAAGAVVHGVVRDAAGTPAPAVQVTATWGVSSLERDVVSTDAAGRFRFVGVGPGVVRLTAGTGRPGRATAVLDAASSAVLEWSPTLDADAVRIAGRVRIAPTMRALGPFVVVRDDSTRRFVAAVDPDDGSFSFTVPEFELHRLSTLLVYPAAAVDEVGRSPSFAAACASGVGPGSVDIELHVAAPPNDAYGSIRAVLAVPASTTVQGVALLSTVPGDRIRLVSTPQPAGAAVPIHASGLRPGRYWLAVDGARLRTVDVGVGQHVELGTIEAPVRDRHASARSLTLAFVAPPEQGLFGRLFVEVRRASGEFVLATSVRRVGGAWRLPVTLPPGAYGVTAVDPTGAWASSELRVEERSERAPYAVRIALRRD